ncbi:MAG: Flagellar hook protein FlgE [Ignavibacteria bacterium]|nr:Flagellar hook protein FlgE [Ignavibacteria bacterium]
MGISRSLSTGSSALKANQFRMDVISNNIANTNTIGFKGSRVSFAEQFNQIYNYGKSSDTGNATGLGGTNPMQVGLGVGVGATTRLMSQGMIEMTSRPLDMALQGDGFFIYNMSGRQLFSRAAAITRDKDGYLVDASSGSYLQGYNLSFDAKGKINKDSTGINVLNRKLDNLKIAPNIISEPKQTQNVSIQGNLNSAAVANEKRDTSVNIIDSQGGSHALGLTFTKGANPNEYSASATIDGKAVAITPALITFNSDGSLKAPLTLSVKAADMNTQLGAGVTVFDATKDLTLKLADANNILGGLTQFSAPSDATPIEPDGFQSGSLNYLSVDNEGKIWGGFSNGQSEILGQVAISKFTNQDGLLNEGGNFYSVSPNSGQANIGIAGSTFPSTKVAGSSLEQSNVDLTEQFTEMISTQRAFEAASRTITVSDQLLAETTALKR